MIYTSAVPVLLSVAVLPTHPDYYIFAVPPPCAVYGGVGVDNLQTPTFADFTGTPEQYDQMNFDAVRAEISSSNRPNIFGLYAVAPNTAMKQFGIHSPAAASTIQFEDSQIAQTVALLKSVGIYDQTEIVIVNDHGNTAINTVIPDSGPGSIDQFLNDNGIPTDQTTTDRVALVWLR